MSKPFKSQWDFGELFPREASRQILSVSELTLQLKRLVEKEIGEIWVAGEITNLRVQSSGHSYFTLKDRFAQFQCVLFRGDALLTGDLLKDGAKVLLRGFLTVYEARGQVQLRVTEVELEGIGALQRAFEQLKQKLQAQGLFAQERKRPLPRYPVRIGVVTSPSGAAFRDILHVIARRQSRLEIILAACRVQGATAAQEIACAIALLNEWARPGDPARHLDLILVTRGGGSLEDLWAFNEEAVARAIFHSALPVVSAVGHEIDFTISDFVADFRAATPSVAAEIITEGMFLSREAVGRFVPDLRTRMRRALARARDALQSSSHRLDRAHPRARLNEQWQRLDDLQEVMLRCVRSRLRDCQFKANTLAARLNRVRPAATMLRRRQALLEWERRLLEAPKTAWSAWLRRTREAEGRLQLLSPLNVLGRGYSITTDAASGRVVRDSASVQTGQRLKTKLQSGEITSVAAPDQE